MEVLECMYIRQAIDLMQGLIPRQDDHDANKQLSKPHLQKLFVFALMWSLGALLELDDRCVVLY